MSDEKKWYFGGPGLSGLVAAMLFSKGSGKYYYEFEIGSRLLVFLIALLVVLVIRAKYSDHYDEEVLE